MKLVRMICDVELAFERFACPNGPPPELWRVHLERPRVDGESYIREITYWASAKESDAYIDRAQDLHGCRLIRVDVFVREGKTQ